jgi:arginyl-tRNA synthetase
MSKIARTPPVKIGEELAQTFNEDLKKTRNLRGRIYNANNAGGFLNIRIKEDFLYDVLREICAKKEVYGKNNLGEGKKVLLEFVSANPTGPLTIAHGRQAAIGSTLRNILKACGFDVKTEYYINDEGRQIEALGESLRARYLNMFGIEADFPEDGYRGAYMNDIALGLKRRHGDKPVKDGKRPIAFFADYACGYILNTIKQDLREFGCEFDVWFSQKTLRGRIKRALKRLKKGSFVYEKDGATWFESSKFGDDKDRVLVKSDGSLTYIMSDIAYHLLKYERGFKELINIWGPDHHGYIQRLKASVEALGYDRDSLRIIIAQLVSLYRGGQPVSMSTRAGEFVSLKELVSEVGKDAARLFFVLRKTDSHLDFDLELAKKESPDNPVYYIQYAHARIHGIIDHYRKNRKRAGEKSADLSLLDKPEELDLIKMLYLFPGILKQAGKAGEPYRLVLYAKDLAYGFHKFYTNLRIVSRDEALTDARLYLARCAKTVLGNSLNILGVSSPEKM